MADLIDRDALMKKICWNECGSVCDEECETAFCNFYDYIMDAPTIEAEPVRHGRWIPTMVRGTLYNYCSVCDNTPDVIYDFPICPNCGAQMDEDTY